MSPPATPFPSGLILMTGLGKPMPGTRTSPKPPMFVAMLMAFLLCGTQCLEVAAADASPVAPTILDAHRYFEALVSGNAVTALDETKSKAGEFLGYESISVLEYKGSKCNSGLLLKNNVKVDIDWAVVDKTESGDGTLNIFSGQEVQFRFFHMVSIEGGVLVEPSNPLSRLILGVTDELSRNRLFKAIALISAACRTKSKFD